MHSAYSALPKPHFTHACSDSYLKDLRTNVPSRPVGARAPPTSFVAQRRALFDSTSEIGDGQASENESLELGPDAPQPLPAYPSSQESRRSSMISSHRGRPLVRHPKDPPRLEVDIGKDEEDGNPEPFIPYTESGTRWMEKQEVRSVSQALRDMDLKDEERLYNAAQAEASELVWKHQNPHAPYSNPEQPYDYHAHLRKGSHARSRSWMNDLNMSKRRRDGSSSRSVSNGSKSSGNNSSRIPSDSSMKSTASPITPVEDSFGDELRDPAKSAVHFKEPAPEKVILKDPKGKVTPPKHDDSNQDEQTKVSNLAIAARMVSNAAPINLRNPFARAKQTKTGTAPVSGLGKFDKIEIQRNPPTQSRNPAYTTNDMSLDLDVKPVEEDIKMRDGMEVRNYDIRKATSMSLKDRSPNLPTPAMVSDSPGRPIVSFDKNWKPKDVQLEATNPVHERTPSPLDLPDPVMKRSQTDPVPIVYPPARSIPSIAIGEPVARPYSVPTIQVDNHPPIPTIAVNDMPTISVEAPIPSIAVNDAPTISISAPTIAINDIPTISVNDVPTISINNTPTISISSSTRPLPDPSHTAKQAPRPTIRTTTSGTALCAACALPISGRTVTAAGARFHPSCFRCHVCSTGLECVAFYPEPASAQAARAASEGAAADPSPRFYCHLDYHEAFSARCKGCGTPIEGAVVLACSASWHPGHFFCAGCGDPFDADTPFVERDGYAWCVGCAAKRYSGKCKRCRQPILDTVVEALGAEWHEECFCCGVSLVSVSFEFLLCVQMLVNAMLTSYRNVKGRSKMGGISCVLVLPSRFVLRARIEE